MANGFTEDGGVIDLPSWTASDGPGIGRAHYYFKSPSGADTQMQTLLQNAVVTIESGPWFDSDGNIVGKRVPLVSAQNKRLVAQAVFQDDAKPEVLVFTCSGLRNLLATTK
jgi:hypothetical protein